MVFRPTRNANRFSQPFAIRQGGVDYASLLKAIPNLLGYWQLIETSGTTINDSSGNARTGSYVNGVALANTAGPGASMGSAPKFDGTNDYGNLFSAGLAAAFNGAAGTLAVWFKAVDSSVWTDNVQHALIRVFVNSSNRVDFIKLDNTGLNKLRINYRAGNVAKSFDVATTTTAWAHAAITWDKAADQVKVYFNGVQQGATQTGLGTWAGTPSTALLSAGDTVPNSVWPGWLAHGALWSAALSAADNTTIATAI